MHRFGEVETKQQSAGCCSDYRAPQDCPGFVRGHFWPQSMPGSKAAYSHPHTRFPQASTLQAAPLTCGSEFQSALTNESMLSVLAWNSSPQCETAENRRLLQEQNWCCDQGGDHSPRFCMQSPPCLWCCSLWTAQGSNTHSNSFLG